MICGASSLAVVCLLLLFTSCRHGAPYHGFHEVVFNDGEFVPARLGGTNSNDFVEAIKCNVSRVIQEGRKRIRVYATHDKIPKPIDVIINEGVDGSVSVNVINARVATVSTQASPGLLKVEIRFRNAWSYPGPLCQYIVICSGPKWYEKISPLVRQNSDEP